MSGSTIIHRIMRKTKRNNVIKYLTLVLLFTSFLSSFISTSTVNAAEATIFETYQGSLGGVSYKFTPGKAEKLGSQSATITKYSKYVYGFTAPYTGYYNFEIAGAKGGDDRSGTSGTSGGKGGLVKFNVKMDKGTTYYISLGQQGWVQNSVNRKIYGNASGTYLGNIGGVDWSVENYSTKPDGGPDNGTYHYYWTAKKDSNGNTYSNVFNKALSISTVGDIVIDTSKAERVDYTTITHTVKNSDGTTTTSDVSTGRNNPTWGGGGRAGDILETGKNYTMFKKMGSAPVYLTGVEHFSGVGGGATFVATKLYGSGKLSSYYTSTADRTSTIIAVAGGGGGASAETPGAGGATLFKGTSISDLSLYSGYSEKSLRTTAKKAASDYTNFGLGEYPIYTMSSSYTLNKDGTVGSYPSYGPDGGGGGGGIIGGQAGIDANTSGGYKTVASGGGASFVNTNYYKTGLSSTASLKSGYNAGEGYVVITGNAQLSYPVKYDKNLSASTVSNMPDDAIRLFGDDYVVSTKKPTATGYKFVSWNTKKDGSGTTYTAGSTYSGKNDDINKDGSLTLYAQWTPNTYKNSLLYNANTTDTVTNMPSAQTVNVTYPKTSYTHTVNTVKPVRTGYIFWGWYTDKTNGTKVGATQTVGSDNVTNNQSLTVYAHWQINKYSVTYNLYLKGTDGKYVLSNTKSEFNIENGTKITLADKGEYYAPNSYTFKGGKKVSVTSSALPSSFDKEITVSSNTIIDLYYDRTSYTVTLSGDEGINSTSGAGTYEWGKTVNISSVVKPGYTFKAWTGNVTPSSTANATTFTMPANSVTLKATTTPNHYTNKLMYNANTDDTSVNNIPTSQEQDVVFPNTSCEFTVSTTIPTRTGYDFAGWYSAKTNGTKAGAKFTVGANNVTTGQSATLYAYWTPKTYTNTLMYDTNTTDTVTNMPSKQELQVTYPDTSCEFTISTVIPRRVGYAFIGWGDTADSEKALSGKVTVGEKNKTSGQSKTLYAIWLCSIPDLAKTVENVYSTVGVDKEGFIQTVKFHSSGASGIMPDQTLADGDKLNLNTLEYKATSVEEDTTKTIEGEFLGWTNDVNNVVIMYKDGCEYYSVNNDETEDLYAIWKVTTTITDNDTNEIISISINTECNNL